MKAMVDEFTRKSNRPYPPFLSFFRTVTIRSKSLDNLYDHNQRKEGKTKKSKRIQNKLFCSLFK